MLDVTLVLALSLFLFSILLRLCSFVFTFQLGLSVGTSETIVWGESSL